MRACFRGLKFVSKNRSDRIKAIAQEISTSKYDIVALQELWVFADYEQVQRTISNKLPYSKFFFSGALGAGLVFFSRFPIISTSVHPYSLNGAPLDVAAGDWFVGKAAVSILVQHPVLREIEIFNTHLFAKGGEDGPEHNRAHRLVNAWEFAKRTRQAAELGRYVVALGDFNSIPTTLPMTIIREHAGLIDSWSVTHPNEDSSPPPSSPEDAIARFGVTADSPLNTYSAGKPLDPHARRFLGKRLDYIFYRQPHRSHLGDIPRLRAIDCNVVLTKMVPGSVFSFSDHFGLEATLEVTKDGSASHPNLSDGSTPSAVTTSSELNSASITTVIQALSACYEFSQQRSRKELGIFVLCLLLLLAFILGSAWFPYAWLNPIFGLITVFLSWLATTMLYEGFLYGCWERNALMNVIEELGIHEKSLKSHPDQLINLHNY